ncbi:hypothetical protein G6N82_03145 [Altererythrobacter sp. BO-6]|uniref:hypothetical protein n=1 Tax=Altererythrobacter sp. BO-6 TaxID=2604537 RepID=UPI0013E14537|nr:hypothetical protein [Altererythrobacter sp. BO-6]QIG53280.1 hypothetical protein G6N82_03145 [Altererythrobacter sp. BO-6]
MAGLVPIVLLIGLCTLVYWASADFADNQAELEGANGNQSIFRRLFRWLNKPTERLDYRRDKLGRFRKVRRG